MDSQINRKEFPKCPDRNESNDHPNNYEHGTEVDQDIGVKYRGSPINCEKPPRCH